MKIFRKSLAILIVVLMVVVFAACGKSADNSGSGSNSGSGNAAAPIKIGILKWVTHNALDASEQGFVDALAAAGYKDGDNITIDHQNANGDTTVAATISDKFVNDKEDLILAIATPSVQSLQAKTTTIPILGTAVTDYVGAKLITDNNAPGGNISGTSDLTPVAEQFDLLMQVMPTVKTVGIMYNSSEDNSRIQAETAQQIAESKGLKVKVKTCTSVNDIQQTAQALAKDVDVFWIPTDNMIASAMDVLSTVTMDKKIPIVCGEENMVAAGGTFTIGIDYYQLGYQTGEMAVKILKGEATTATMPIEYQKNYSIAINKANADALGLTFPADVLATAKDVSK